MKRKTKMKLSVFCLLLSVFCVLSFAQQKFIDDLGYEIYLSHPPRRIISLAPNITEILFALGLGDQIVGVTRYCDYPPQALTKEKIGGIIDINLEKIKYLNPNLVLAFRGNPLELIQRLRQLEINVFVFDIQDRMERIFSLIQKIGLLTGRTNAAEKLLTHLKQKYNWIQKKLLSVTNRPKVFLSLHGQGLWTCGKSSFLNDLIIKAKGENIAGEIHRSWIKYNQEELIYKNPEIIIILAKKEKDFLSAKKWWENNSPLKQIKAVKTQKIFFLDENLISRPGPRLIDGLYQLAKILHPEVF
ncbi:MAG: ABC transporter substrate-binding protein [Candidatus Aminicenantia bacterium]